jgi:hypothetical protein
MNMHPGVARMYVMGDTYVLARFMIGTVSG